MPIVQCPAAGVQVSLQYRPLQPGVEALDPGVDPGHPRPPAPDPETDNPHLE